MLGQDILGVWGITRVSLDWRTPGVRDVLDAVGGLGWEVNLYGVPDLESFLEAALLLPASVTADFGFPEWSRDEPNPSGGVPVTAGLAISPLHADVETATAAPTVG